LNQEHFAEWIQQIHRTTEAEIDCDCLQRLLPAYVDARLAGLLPGSVTEIENHLRQCPDCSADYVGLSHVASLERHGRLPEVEELLPAGARATASQRPQAAEDLAAVTT
jgi:predicted anti-sigma-YlaC factor YlaD